MARVSLEAFGRGPEELLLPCGIRALGLRAFEQGLAQLVDHLVVAAEVEAALLQFGISVFENAGELRRWPRRGNPFCLFTRPLSHAMVQRLPGGVESARVVWRVAARSTASSSRPSLKKTRARLSGPSARPSFSTRVKGVGGLDQFALFAALVALEEQADAVVVPALPLGDGRRRVRAGAEIRSARPLDLEGASCPSAMIGDRQVIVISEADRPPT
jgi:hypothetical protein